MAKEDVYIKDGVILRGNEATEELARKDAEEVIKESGLGSHVKKKNVTLRLRKPSATSTAKMCKSDSMSATATGASVSADLAQGEATAHGVKVKALNASGEGLNVKGTLRAFGEVVGAQLKAATLGGQALGFDLRGEAGTSLKAMDLKSLNASLSGVQTQGHISSTATAKLVDAKVANANVSGVEIAAEAEASVAAKLIDTKLANADVTGLDTAAEAGATATAKGADIKAANLRVAGAEITARAEAKAQATGLDINAANAKVVGYKKHSGAGVSAQAKGIEAKVGTANITGVEKKKEITAEVKAVGNQVEAANVKLVGKKAGASAKARVEAQGAQVQVANVNVEGKDSSISASANLNVAAASARVANANITPLDGAHFHATADISPGVDAFNAQVGTHKGAGIGVSTRLQFGNVHLSAGPPNLHFGPGLNLGFGGSTSKSGKQNGGGSHSDGSSYTTEGRHRVEERLGQQAQPGPSKGYQASAGTGENKQGTMSACAKSDGRNTRDTGRAAKANAYTEDVPGGNGDKANAIGGGPSSSSNYSEYNANSSGHIASGTEYKTSGSGHHNANGKDYSSSTGNTASTTAAGQGSSKTHSEASDVKGTTREATKRNGQMTTMSTASSSRQTTSAGHHDTGSFAKSNGYASGGTKHRSGYWTTDGEHDVSGTGYATKTRGYMIHNTKYGTRFKEHENASGEFDSSGFGSAIKSGGHTGGSTTWKSGINGDGTASTELKTGNAGHVIKRGERGSHMTSSTKCTQSNARSSGMDYKSRKNGHETTGVEFDVSRREVVGNSGHMSTSTVHRLNGSGHKKESSGPIVGNADYSSHGMQSRQSTEFKSRQRTTMRVSDMSSATKRSEDDVKHNHNSSGVEKRCGDRYSASDARQVMRTTGHTDSSKTVPVVKHSASGNKMTSKPATGEEVDNAQYRDDHARTGDQFATRPNTTINRVGQSSNYGRNASPHMRQSSGFASTYHRNDSYADPDHKPKMQTEGPDSGAGFNKGSASAVPDHGWKRPSNESEEDDRSKKKGTTDYKDMLASQVSKHFQSFQLPESKKKQKSEKKELPSSRQEAKQELIRRLRKVQQQNALESGTVKDDSEVSGSGKEKKGDAGSKAQGTGERSASEGDDSTASKPKEKPFGSNKNIHTLGCFQNESSKKVKQLRGRVHGFEA